LYDSENSPKDIAIEVEEELNEDDKGPTILKNVVLKPTKDMQRKKAIVNVSISIDLLKEMGNIGLK
jgi:hypothetical protein